ncbi:MAG: SagB/ThcOx family dehydrogenase [Candidatus Cloacimonetes bacterium]|nr:SagB/ThcOx family dehydrogenase [Candidatus Cloacimonadota bacterium]
MDIKKFYYLYFKIRDEAKDVILKEANLSEDEYDRYETELVKEIDLLKAERSNLYDIGADFVRFTRYLYEPAPDSAKGAHRPDAVKPLNGEIIPLPAVGVIKKPEMSLHQAIEQRRSLRSYSDEPFSQEELSFLLWATQWVRDFRSTEKMEVAFRNVPSAGARHPFETYLLINKVQGIKPGIYYYHPTKHGLVLFKEGKQCAEEVFRASFEQEMVLNSAVTFIWEAVPNRTTWRYSQRGYRYLYLDAGHVGQNLHLATEALNAGACMIGAYYDEGINEILRLDGKESFIIYMASAGKKKA